MSAFMVGDAHISYLVKAIRHYGIQQAYPTLPTGAVGLAVELASMTDDELGRWLTEVNLTSMDARYGDRLSPEERAMPGQYQYKAPETPLTPVQVIEAADCFEYQACEFDGWRLHAARDLMHGLVESAVRDLPGFKPAYAKAEWVIDA